VANWVGKSKEYVAEYEEQIQAFAERVEATCYRRRFILTDDGAMELVPRKAEVGDLIVFFEEGLYPLVIRDQGHGTFALIGDCFPLRYFRRTRVEENERGQERAVYHILNHS
jgi:hypothetical protein